MGQHQTVVEQSPDVINHPAHYNHGNIECLTYLEDSLGDGFEFYLEGNVKKYLHRWRYKNASLAGQIEDLNKAQFYLNALIKAKEYKT